MISNNFATFTKASGIVQGSESMISHFVAKSVLLFAFLPPYVMAKFSFFPNKQRRNRNNSISQRKLNQKWLSKKREEVVLIFPFLSFLLLLFSETNCIEITTRSFHWRVVHFIESMSTTSTRFRISSLESVPPMMKILWSTVIAFIANLGYVNLIDDVNHSFFETSKISIVSR